MSWHMGPKINMSRTKWQTRRDRWVKYVPFWSLAVSLVALAVAVFK